MGGFRSYPVTVPGSAVGTGQPKSLPSGTPPSRKATRQSNHQGDEILPITAVGGLGSLREEPVLDWGPEKGHIRGSWAEQEQVVFQVRASA